MRYFNVFLLGLLLPFAAIAAEGNPGENLTYTERMGLYADWAVVILLVVVIVAVVRNWRKK